MTAAGCRRVESRAEPVWRRSRARRADNLRERFPDFWKNREMKLCELRVVTRPKAVCAAPASCAGSWTNARCAAGLASLAVCSVGRLVGWSGRARRPGEHRPSEQTSKRIKRRKHRSAVRACRAGRGRGRRPAARSSALPRHLLACRRDISSMRRRQTRYTSGFCWNGDFVIDPAARRIAADRPGAPFSVPETAIEIDHRSSGSPRFAPKPRSRRRRIRISRTAESAAAANHRSTSSCRRG